MIPSRLIFVKLRIEMHSYPSKPSPIRDPMLISQQPVPVFLVLMNFILLNPNFLILCLIISLSFV